MSKIAIDRSVVEQALTTLEGWGNYDKWVWPESALFTAKKNTAEMITALRAALEQPQVEQEPAIYPEEAFDMGLEAIPYYTHPQPPRQPLSDEEVKAICYTGPVYAPDGKVTRTPEQYKREIADARMHGIRQAERAHGIGGGK